MKLEAGIRYGKWTTQPDPTDKRNHTLCKCDCGTIRAVYTPLLTGGYSNSCGCTKTKHGLSKHPMYNSWRSMRRRCDKNLKGYENISYPDEWKDFPTFISDAEKFRTKFRKGLTLDRTNFRLSYSAANCDWQTKKQQAENRTHSTFLHSRFGRFTLTEWWRTFNMLKGGKTASLKMFKTGLQMTDGDIDRLLLTLRIPDDQLQARVNEYQRQVMTDSLKKIGLTEEQIAGYLDEMHLGPTVHSALDQDQELVPA